MSRSQLPGHLVKRLAAGVERRPGDTAAMRAHANPDGQGGVPAGNAYAQLQETSPRGRAVNLRRFGWLAGGMRWWARRLMVTEVPACRDSAQRRGPRGASPRYRLPRMYHLPLQHRFRAARSVPMAPTARSHGTVGANGTL